MPDVAVLHHTYDGPGGSHVVVLANSLGTTVSMWDPLVPALAGRFRVLRYDHRGHGGSPVLPGPYSIEDLGGDLLALLDREGIGRVSLCGLSLGGMVGMWLAASAPERVDRLALLCTAAHLPPPSFWSDRAATVRARGTGAIADTVMARWFTPTFRASRPEVVARAAADLAAVPDEGYAGCCEAIGALDLRPVLGRIAAKTLVVAGADDPATPPERAEEIVAGIPDARLVVLPETAHIATLERPETVSRLLLDHLAR